MRRTSAPGVRAGGGLAVLLAVLAAGCTNPEPDAGREDLFAELQGPTQYTTGIEALEWASVEANDQAGKVVPLLERLEGGAHLASSEEPCGTGKVVLGALWQAWERQTGQPAPGGRYIPVHHAGLDLTVGFEHHSARPCPQSDLHVDI